MSLIQSLKKYFTAIDTGNTNENAPEGICPNCWGK